MTELVDGQHIEAGREGNNSHAGSKPALSTKVNSMASYIEQLMAEIKTKLSREENKGKRLSYDFGDIMSLVNYNPDKSLSDQVKEEAAKHGLVVDYHHEAMNRFDFKLKQ